MKWLDNLRVSHYHQKRKKQYGQNTAQTLGWQDTDSQQSRFEVLCRDVNLDGAIVLDVGCGYADLLVFIEEQGIRLAHYTGIEQHKEFALAARKRRFQTETDVIKGDFSAIALPVADYVFASGSLNYQSSNPHHTVEMIRRMYHSSQIACVFNLLDEAKLPSMKLLVAHNKKGVLRYCRLLSPESYLIEGYSEHDFTVVMPKSTEI